MAEQQGAAPALTVVVICYDDAAHLPQALHSVLDQTLKDLEVVVVDDASSDDSFAVARRAEQADPRVRAHRLPVNSGGCSRPRNHGLGLARGRYVMFLDSDDELERHACKSLLLAAERTGADLVAGRLVREVVGTRRRSAWRSELYRERTVLQGVAERPEQLDDTTATSKLYRRQFLDDNGIRFPEGLLYEDLLFTTEAYCSAERIAIEPVLVYRWKVREDSEKPSITNRHGDLRNLQDRLAVHRRVDAYLDDHGLAALRPVKDQRFLQHDAWLYLRMLPVLDEALQHEVVELIGAYADDMDDAVRERVTAWYRMILFLLRQRDVEHLREAAQFRRHGGSLVPELVRRGDRVLWTAAYLGQPEADDALDVSDLGLHLLGFDQVVLHHALTRLETEGSVLRLAGVTRLPEGLPGEQPVALALQLRRRGSAPTVSVELADVSVTGRHLRWSAEVDLAELLVVPQSRKKIWDVDLEVTVGLQSNRSPLALDPVSPALADVQDRVLRIRAARSWVEGDRLRAYTTRWGHLAFRQVHTHPRAVRVATAVRRVEDSSPAATVRRVLALRHGPGLKSRVYARLLVRLPIRRGSVVFESHMGKQYSDSPRRIYEALRAVDGRRRMVWSRAAATQQWPADVPSVERGSWRYALEVARAEFWVDNQGFLPLFRKRPGTTYIQTWHGQPLKTMGFDEPAIRRGRKATQRALRRAVRQWDLMCIPSEYTVRTLVTGLRYKGPLLRTGLPRNDPLVAQRARPDAVRVAQERLGLPTDRTVVLYAPTFRDARRSARLPFQLALDLREWVRVLGHSHYLLVRCHYLDRLSVPRHFHPWVRNVSGHHDATELLEAADVLVTDYSSVMFDFAITERPQVYFAYDLAKYTGDERGTYVDLEAVAPGPLVTSTEDLLTVLGDPDALDGYREARRDFFSDYCEHETGAAADSVVGEILSRGSR